MNIKEILKDMIYALDAGDHERYWIFFNDLLAAHQEILDEVLKEEK